MLAQTTALPLTGFAPPFSENNDDDKELRNKKIAATFKG